MKAALARDQEGKPIELPEAAVGWRVRRKTGGRPSVVLGADGKPLVLGLDTEQDELADVLEPGSYRLKAVTAEGEPLDVHVNVEVPERAGPAVAVAADMGALVQALAACHTANVEMARANADALKAVTGSVGDFLRGLGPKAVGRVAQAAATVSAPSVVEHPVIVAAAPAVAAEEPEAQGSRFDRFVEMAMPFIGPMLPQLGATLMARLAPNLVTPTPKPAPAQAPPPSAPPQAAGTNAGGTGA